MLMKLYGTTINSDISFPIDSSCETATRCEVELSAGEFDLLEKSITYGFPLYSAHGRNVYLYSDREFDNSETGQSWCYEVEDVVRFYWRGGEPSINYVLGRQGNNELLSFWFIHLLLPLYLTLEYKFDFLHAGAVEVAEKPVLFIAPSEGGKSTLVDYFIRQGHTLFSDDKVATFSENGMFFAAGSHPYHRPFRRFEDLGYRVEHFATQFKPIGAFYMLDRTDPDAEVAIEEINGVQKFDALMPNYLYMFRFLRAKRLRYLAALLNQTRVYEAKVPWSLDRLGEVHDAICVHAKKP